MGRLVAQYNIIGKAALGALGPALVRLGLILLGIILGMIWAYQFAPVKFYDAEPVHLADGYKDQWIKMSAVELADSGDAEEAKNKIVDGGVTPDMIERLIAENQAADPELASQLAPLLAIANANKSAAESQADKIEQSFFGSLLGPLACLVGAAVVGLIVSVILTLYWAPPFLKRSGATTSISRVGAPAGAAGAASVHSQRVEAKKDADKQRTDFEIPPISQYMSTYILGDELYDDSFSIETAADEFLGECGSGISETIGVGDTKKVTATEVWLFDKNDIRTVTQVLMSEHAFNDQALRTKLAPKGEAVKVGPGAISTLETQTLRVQVRVVDVQYGEGPLPPNSYFERLTVELAAWRKENGADGGAKPADAAAFGDTAELLNY